LFYYHVSGGFQGTQGCEEAHSEDDGGEGYGTSIVRPEIIV